MIALIPLLVSLLPAPAGAQFKDPAPPALAKLETVAPSKPAANTNTRFHRKPKPLSASAITHDWTSFLGPTHNGISTETRLAKKFPSSGPPLVWEMKKGTGYSSPAVQGDYLVFLHRQGNQEIVECLKADTGERFWQYPYATAYEDRYGYNSGPRTSPTIDGDRVYTYGAEGKLHCLRLTTGQILWKRDILSEFKVLQDFFGVSSTPLVEGDMLIVQVGAPGGPTVAGFDKLTGRLLWGAGKEWSAGYAAPIPATVHGKRRIFAFTGGESQPPKGGLLVIDPRTGALETSFPWRSKSYESVNASCPVIFGNNVFLSASYKTGGAMLEMQPDGKHKVAWTTPDFGMHFSTPIYKDGYLYGFEGRNEPDASLACLNAKTGKVMWRAMPEWKETFEINGDKREQLLSTYRGSILHVDGRFLVLGEMGHLLWMDLTPQGHKETSRAWLFAARQTWSLPVLSRGLLYIVQHERDAIHGTQPRLLCYDLRE
ncbi:MAG: PQQ-like beta-propeller repeat protein [Acidobacteria bacterium]|nr:PQQ-like beta-propeller repeat protein [Acidobacteriota bacterium]